jgi:hypothetical protein
MGNADTGKILGKLKEFNDCATGDGLRLSDNQLQQIHELVNGNTNNLDTKINLLFQLLKWPIGKSNEHFPLISYYSIFFRQNIPDLRYHPFINS